MEGQKTVISEKAFFKKAVSEIFGEIVKKKSYFWAQFPEVLIDCSDLNKKSIREELSKGIHPCFGAGSLHMQGP